MSDRIILITGATGRQGGALIDQLEGRGFRLRALTRKPQGDRARALAASGVEIAAGDFDDPASLRAALTGAWGAFAVQNTWEAGVVKEEEQGKRFATLAREAGVQHLVYTSVESAEAHTGIPHFENKARVEDTIRGLGFPSYAIFRPVFFMENLASPWFLDGHRLVSALDPATRVQMIASADIGRFIAPAFIDPARFNRREIDIAGDTATMPEAAAALGEALGRTITSVRIPMADVRRNSDDFATMLEWFERVGYSADIPGLEREFGFRTTRLREWAAALPIAA